MAKQRDSSTAGRQLLRIPNDRDPLRQRPCSGG